MGQEGRPSSGTGSEGGLYCTQGHFVPYFGPTTWLSIGGVKFCMQCVVERVVPFLDMLSVGRVVEGTPPPPPPPYRSDRL